MSRHSHPYDTIALACQGGGALGAYYIGVYKALAEYGYIPNVFSGISIGAFTAAILAGNKPEERLEKLKGFWKHISWSHYKDIFHLDPYWAEDAPRLKKIHNFFSSFQSLLFGQPAFFKPRFPSPDFYPNGTEEATSYYDTSLLKDTLEKFIDFDLINSQETRLFLGTVRVKDGEFVFFDNFKTKIFPEHIMASGAMPPGFPGIRIEGDLYWDGGCVDNTPLEAIYEVGIQTNTLVFMVDLFNKIGDEPKNMDDVQRRLKDMQFANRSASHLRRIKSKHNYRSVLQSLWEQMPHELREDPIIKELCAKAISYNFDIVRLVYDAPSYELSSKDYEFSVPSIEDRQKHGYLDMVHILEEGAWVGGGRMFKGTVIHKYTSTKGR